MVTYERITLLFVLQFCAVVVVILIVVFRPGGWSAARWIGLAIAIPAAVVLFTARWQLGTSFSVTPQARELVTHGVCSKIRNPIYLFSAVLVTAILVALQYRYAFLLLAVPMQIIRARQESRVLEAKFGDEYRSYRKGTWV